MSALNTPILYMNPRTQGGFTILYPLHAPASIRVHIQFCHLLSISKDVAPVMTFHALYVAVTLIIVCGFTASICLCCTQMFLGRKHSFLVKLRSHWSVHILSVLVKKSATFFIYFFFVRIVFINCLTLVKVLSSWQHLPLFVVI